MLKLEIYSFMHAKTRFGERTRRTIYFLIQTKEKGLFLRLHLMKQICLFSLTSSGICPTILELKI